MKKILFLFLVLAMVAVFSPAMASPWLTCDCSIATENITGAQLQFGTAAYIDVPVFQACGTVIPNICMGASKTICYDLASLPIGPFTVKGKFKNAWGASVDSLPFSDTKVVPSSTSIRMIQ